jgi:hypothetical protein
MRHDEIFERLDPPPGGLAALRARMNARPSFARRAAPIAVGLALAAIIVLVVTRRPDPVAAARAHADVGEVALGLAPMPSAPVSVDDPTTTAIVPVKTENPRVAFYWVSSTTWGE